MYHRFEENKYPSTNIKMKEFVQHINLIRKNKIEFVNPSKFESELINNKSKRKILLTIDDGYKSFYEKAWPILKESKIPFILFVSTREVGKNGYMNLENSKGEPKRRQEKLIYYARNGAAIYIVKYSCIMEKNSLYGDKILNYEMPKEYSIDIDDEIDWKIAEYLLNNRKI